MWRLNNTYGTGARGNYTRSPSREIYNRRATNSNDDNKSNSSSQVDQDIQCELVPKTFSTTDNKSQYESDTLEITTPVPPTDAIGGKTETLPVVTPIKARPCIDNEPTTATIGTQAGQDDLEITISNPPDDAMGKTETQRVVTPIEARAFIDSKPTMSSIVNRLLQAGQGDLGSMAASIDSICDNLEITISNPPADAMGKTETQRVVTPIKSKDTIDKKPTSLIVVDKAIQCELLRTTASVTDSTSESNTLKIIPPADAIGGETKTLPAVKPIKASSDGNASEKTNLIMVDRAVQCNMEIVVEIDALVLTNLLSPITVQDPNPDNPSGAASALAYYGGAARNAQLLGNIYPIMNQPRRNSTTLQEIQAAPAQGRADRNSHLNRKTDPITIQPLRNNSIELQEIQLAPAQEGGDIISHFIGPIVNQPTNDNITTQEIQPDPQPEPDHEPEEINHAHAPHENCCDECFTLCLKCIDDCSIL